MKATIIVPKISASWKGTVEMASTHTQFYLDKQNAKWKGVCSGIADYTGVDVKWVRIGAIVLTCMTIGGGPWIPMAYFAAAWFCEKKPVHLYLNQDDQKFWQGVRQSPARTTRDIRSRFRQIDNRLANIEDYYVSNNKQLADEIESLR
jgi:phage shock protein C